MPKILGKWEEQSAINLNEVRIMVTSGKDAENWDGERNQRVSNLSVLFLDKNKQVTNFDQGGL